MDQGLLSSKHEHGSAFDDAGLRPPVRPEPPRPDPSRVAIIGAGPAGLTAAYALQRFAKGYTPIVLEAGNLVGGIARTETYKGFRFDIGGHRFYTKAPEIQALWSEICGEDFITRPRASRIFYRGKFYNYPLKLMNAFANIGPVESVRILASFMRWRIWPHRREDNFEEWVTNRFGQRLFHHFFRSYTEKVWGIPCTEIRADWAAQRIQNLSLSKALLNALTGANDTASLIERFQYPRLGPGMMWEKCRDLIRSNGGEVRTQSKVTKVYRDGARVTAIDVETSDGAGVRREQLEADHFISTMPLRELIACMSPAPPTAVVEASRRLKYRDFLIVTLILDHADPFPDNWIYIHSPGVKVGRIQNFRAWSEEMIPDPTKSSIGMEYFCNEGEDLWQTSDADLVKLAARELEQLGLARAKDVIDGAVIRQRKAYPVYDAEYLEALDVIKTWVLGLENFQTVGRNGMHRYNNQDHSMMTGLLAARNIAGERHDAWSVNLERSHVEEFQVARQPQQATA